MDTDATVDQDGPPNQLVPSSPHLRAQNFVVAGGKFKSVTNIKHVAPTAPSDFRRIPIGDLDLRHEICLGGELGIANRSRGKHSVRRMYSARIHGSNLPMTVALYQGKNAEEEWRQDISQYLWLRHPNLVQLYATSSSCGIHAAIFYDELISAKHLLEKYRTAHFRLVYLRIFLEMEFKDAAQYVQDITWQWLDPGECMKWIRPSTGRLCVDLTAGRNYDRVGFYGVHTYSSLPTNFSILDPPENSEMLVGSLSLNLNEYHDICGRYLSVYRATAILLDASVHVAAVISCSPSTDTNYCMEIAFMPDVLVSDSGWFVNEERQSEMESGWTRVDSRDLANRRVSQEIDFAFLHLRLGAWWLTQANHIFDRLGITSNRDDYFFMDRITYMLALSDIGHSIPPGYLFLCPFADLQADNSPSRFRHPECPAYWSLDSSGVERLSMEEAEQLGFPRLELEMKVEGWSWDESVYAGIREFHRATGYDPYSLDVARDLGYPLFEISTDTDDTFAHIQETEDGTEDSAVGEQPRDVIGDIIGRDSALAPETSWCFDLEMPEPSRNRRILMSAQFGLMLTVGIFWLHDSYSSRQTRDP